MFRRLSPFFILLIFVAAVTGSRARWFSHAIWNLDEGSTFTMGQQVLDGAVLYRDAADNRSPLLPYLKAAVFGVAGDWNTVAVYLVLAVGLGICAWLLFRLGRDLDGPAAGWAAGGSFVALQLLYIDPGDAMSACTEWFVIIFSTIAFALLADALRAPRFRRGPLIGFFFALSMLCKQPGVLDFIVATVLILLLLLPAGQERRRLLELWLGLLAGLLLPLGLTALYFAAHGAWDDYVYYAFTFNTKLYLPEVPLPERLRCVTMPFQMGWDHLPTFLVTGSCAAVAMLGLGLFRLLRRRPQVPVMVWLTVGWIISGLITTTLSGRSFAHYSAQVLPGLSLAIAWLFGRIAAWWPADPARKVRRTAVGLALLLPALALTVEAVGRFWEIEPLLDGADTDPLGMGPAVQRHSTANERLFVWGYFPEFYLFAQRLPATRYIYTNYFTGMIAWTNLDALQDVTYAISPGAHEKFYHDWTSHPPAVVVDTAGNRGYAKFPLAAEEPLWSLLQAGYAEVELELHRRSGMHVYRELTPLPAEPAPLPAEVVPDSGLQVSGYFDLMENQVPRLEVAGPSGFDQLELYRDGHLLARLPYPPAAPIEVRFFVPPTTAAGPTDRRLQVRATGPAGTHVSEPFDFDAFVAAQAAARPRDPALHLGTTALPPTIANVPFTYLGCYSVEDDYWQISTPARLVYDCPTSVEQITFAHGPNPAQMYVSDGYDLTVRWLPDEGAPIDLWLKRMEPRLNGSQHVAQLETVTLPPRGPGRLEFRFLTGRHSDSSADQLFFGNLHGRLTGPQIEMGASSTMPSDITTADHHTMARTAEGHWLLPAPANVTWPLAPNLMALELTFGLEVPAAGESMPAATRVELVLQNPAVADQVLLSRVLDPAADAADRAPQTVRVDIPRHQSGQLVLRSTPAVSPTDATATTAAQLWLEDPRGFTPGPPIVISPTRRILTRYTAGFDEGWANPHDNAHWSAQPPQELAYAKPADLTEVDFSFGLYDHALFDDAGNPRGNGVEVVVHYTNAAGESSEVFHRRLDPHGVPTDRGPQQGVITLPADAGGSLHFHMESGPNGDASYDWAYWGPFVGKVTPVSP